MELLLDLDDIDADIDAIPGAIVGADGSEVLLFGDEEDALNAAAAEDDRVRTIVNRNTTRSLARLVSLICIRQPSLVLSFSFSARLAAVLLWHFYMESLRQPNN